VSGAPAGGGPARAGLGLYRDRRMLAIALMGVASGLPLPLTAATLTYRLARAGVDKTSIGLFALVGLPYALKFLWAPLLDRAAVPGLDAWLGRRRGWALATQAALAVAILGLGGTDPARAPLATAAWALAVAFLSASQDVAIDAYRIEVLAPHEQGAGAAATQGGYRIGLLAAGAGAIALADYAAWPVVFAVLSSLIGVGSVGVLVGPEPPAAPRPAGPPSHGAEAVRRAVLEPLRDFATRPLWGVLLAFALLYKFGDAIAGVMANPFFVDLHFSGVEIATASNVMGVLANLAGVFAGGVVVARVGVVRALLWGGILQAVTNLLYAALALVGHDFHFLAGAVGIDAFAGGVASAAFVAFLSDLCRPGQTATQYALLTSLMAAGRTVMSSGAGWLAARLAWPVFFTATTFLAAPGLLLLAWIARDAPVGEGGSPAASGAAVARRRRVALLAPMPSELRPLVRRLALAPAPPGAGPFRTGRLGPVDVVAATTGIGTHAAARTAEQLLDTTPVDHLVVVGIAGGIGPSVAVGDVVVPARVLDLASGVAYRPRPLGAAAPRGTLATSDTLLADPRHAAALAAEGVVAIDMETAAIAAACERRGCPWSVFRAISDRADDGSTDAAVLALAHPDGRPNLPAVARLVLTQPGRIPQLLRLARGLRISTNAAASAALRALEAFDAAEAPAPSREAGS
jgi:PAT family beta-lactamase induction signal transducer AmpG